jgi:ABC-type transporter Mla maintaining outer membrane lipid asymmetry ATPase subunit MlaF
MKTNPFEVTEFEQKVERLSDEFQSTFSIVNEKAVANMFDVSECDHVLSLIEKHLNWERSKMKIIKTGQLFGTYDIWVLENGR